jgi:hypothetical protein
MKRFSLLLGTIGMLALGLYVHAALDEPGQASTAPVCKAEYHYRQGTSQHHFSEYLRPE